MANQQAGWYPDPSGDASKLRYWDGMQWTNDVADAQPAQPYGAQSTAYSTPANGQYGAGQAYYQQPMQSAMNSNDQNLRMVAFIFCIISTVSVCWAIIPLAWMIPMSVHCWGIYKGTKPNTTAFGVCTLIFVSLVGGILLLVSNKDQ